MKAVLNRRLLAVRGIVQSVGAMVPMECVLLRSDGRVFPCSLPANASLVQRGEEISVILFDRARTGAVLGLVNHTVIDGENYVRLMARCRPDVWDGVLLSAGFVGAVSALGVEGLAPFALLAAAYWLLAGAIPMARRERIARKVDRLIDQEARSRGTTCRPDEAARPTRSGRERL